MPVTALRRCRAVARALAGIAALLALAAPAAHADALVASAPGEAFTSSTDYIGARSDSAANGGQTLLLGVTGAANRTVQLPGSTTSIVVRVRGKSCDGAPTLRLTVDGQAVLTTTVTATSYTTVSAALTLASGSHALSAALTSDKYVAGVCDRNLWVDQIDFRGASATPPRLRWSPPVLTWPTTISLPQGDVTLNLDPAKDYILKLGSSMHLGGVTVVGGNDIVIKGGAIGLPASSLRTAAFLFKNTTGVVHVEGVWFDGAQGREMDAVQISAPDATVQVENVRATGLLGSYDTNHTDVIQPYGGVLALRVDRLTADSSYQGLFTRPDQGAIGSVTAQNVDLEYRDPGTTTGGYMVWWTTGCTTAKTTLSSVFVQPGPERTLGNSVWPSATDKTCPAVISGNTATWPSLPVTGGVTAGVPASGSFVPAGRAGTGYVSPGYV